MRLRLPLMLLLLTLCTLPCAALDWKAQTLNFTTTPFQAEQDVIFEFTNTSSKPVTVLELETNCDCLDAAVDQKTYPPGASGMVKARFSIGDRFGLYERRIRIVTDETPEPVRLLVRIEVPEIVTITPRSVAWKIGEAVTEKSVEVQTVEGVTIRFTEAQSTSGTFSARLETIEAGRRYRVYLKPPGTTAAANAAIRISGQDKAGQPIVVSAYGNVR